MLLIIPTSNPMTSRLLLFMAIRQIGFKRDEKFPFSTKLELEAFFVRNCNILRLLKMKEQYSSFLT